MLWENLVCVGLGKRGVLLFVGAPKLGLAPGVNCSLRIGDSGRDSDGLDSLPWGLDARRGPKDLLYWAVAGVGGV